MKAEQSTQYELALPIHPVEVLTVQLEDNNLRLSPGLMQPLILFTLIKQFPVTGRICLRDVFGGSHTITQPPLSPLVLESVDSQAN